MEAQKTWVVKVCEAGRKPLWAGPVHAPGRTEAKRAARIFVSEHFSLSARVLCIAPGTLTLSVEGPEIPVEQEATPELVHTALALACDRLELRVLRGELQPI